MKWPGPTCLGKSTNDAKSVKTCRLLSFYKLINYNYDKFNFFLDRNKIGKTIKSVTEVNENIKLIEKNYNLIIKSIELLRKDMKFFGKSKERFVQEVKSMNISFNNSRSKDD